ncbi:hypothetical protein H671_2g5916 [Cricetulus griseus]|uniref:Uncharacterized protein n=1 Tax=Cricetulus griseus TaxID=10029 RepID=A0A061IL80_CRIGR|nr:hypothetical protein H671_2g5916 [Cricetulus griseus]
MKKKREEDCIGSPGNGITSRTYLVWLLQTNMTLFVVTAQSHLTQATCLPDRVREQDPTHQGPVTALPPTDSLAQPSTPEHCRHLGNSDISIHEKRTDIIVLNLFATTRRETWSYTHQENKKLLLRPPEEKMRRGQDKSTSNNRKLNMTPPETKNHTPVRHEHHDADEPEENDIKKSS